MWKKWGANLETLMQSALPVPLGRLFFVNGGDASSAWLKHGFDHDCAGVDASLIQTHYPISHRRHV
jgi:hypothetical protein